MKKIWLILRYELLTSILRPSFLLVAIGVPLVSSLFYLGISAARQKSPDPVSAVFDQSTPAASVPEGYVDQAGIIHSIPASLPAGSLRPYPDEAAAQKALAAGEISAFYLVPADYLQTGRWIYTRPDFNPLSGFVQSGAFEWVLKVNLLSGDEQLARQVLGPMQIQSRPAAPAAGRDQWDILAFVLPYLVTLAYYLMILMSANLLLHSLTREKENRVLEILMASITPRQLFTGKMIGLGLAGLVQAVLWIGTGYSLLHLNGRAFHIPAEFQLPFSFLAWGLLFFVLGYGVYAALMAAVGALVPNLREASQVTFLFILPMVIPLMCLGILIQSPNSALAIALSVFPLTASITMMTRLSSGGVPLWQLLLSTAVLIGAVVWIIHSVARLFRAQTLLSGQPFELRKLLRALAGKS